MEGRQIFEALAAVMEGIDAIGKNKTNQQQNFKYRGIDDAYNAIHPLFKAQGIISVPEVLSVQREDRKSAKGNALIYSIATIKYTFYAKDGSNVSAIVVGEGMDSGDKSMNKAMAIAHKYALMQIFCIPTEGMVDPDADAHQVQKELPPASPDITPDQITCIQTIFSKLGYASKEKRMEDITSWMRRKYKYDGPPLESVKELFKNEANDLIDALQKRLESKPSAPAGTNGQQHLTQ